MTRASSTTRRLITALLVVWLPVCCCQAAGVVHLGMALAGLAAADEPGCSCCRKADPDPADSPASVASRIDCCTASAKIAPRPDRWSPDKDAAAVPIPLAVAHAVLAAEPASAPRARATESPPLRDSQTLLRQRCALII